MAAETSRSVQTTRDPPAARPAHVRAAGLLQDHGSQGPRPREWHQLHCYQGGSRSELFDVAVCHSDGGTKSHRTILAHEPKVAVM